jgi:hypothetical protein
LLAAGEGFAVVCDEVVGKTWRSGLLDRLGRSHDVVRIDAHQLRRFAGNLLNVRNAKGESVVLLSAEAYNALRDDQRERIQKHGRLVPVAVPVIEKVGGGSVRCMLAEIFLPRREGK